jgi:carboxypeptidase C (cathepsin A)
MKYLPHYFVLCVAILLVPLTSFPQAKNDTIPKGEVSTTSHTARIDGKVIAYKALAGTMQLRNNDDEPIALHGFTAYIKEGVTDPKTRPISFVFNGGPGSSSIWLHMGVIGPKRAVVNDPGSTPGAPYTLEDNNSSILDVTDIVMMDPIGTGLSHAIGKAKNKDFWGVDQDIKMISQFIKQFVT